MKTLLTQNKLRQFGLVIAISFSLFLGFLFPHLFGKTVNYYFFIILIPFIFISIFKPIYLKNFYYIWIKIGNFLGFINSNLVLSLVFLIVLLPISFVMKLLRYDPLRTRKNDLQTYKEKIEDKEINFKRIF